MIHSNCITGGGFLPQKLKRRRDIELSVDRRAAFHDYSAAAVRAMRTGNVRLASHFAQLAAEVAGGVR